MTKIQKIILAVLAVVVVVLTVVFVSVFMKVRRMLLSLDVRYSLMKTLRSHQSKENMMSREYIEERHRLRVVSGKHLMQDLREEEADREKLLLLKKSKER